MTDAKGWARQTETDLRAGRYLQTSEARKHTLGETIDRYISEVLPAKKDAVNQKRQPEYWRRRLAPLTLDRITEVDPIVWTT